MAHIFSISGDHYYEINLKVENINTKIKLTMKDVKFEINSSDSLSITYEKKSLKFEDIIDYLKQNNIKVQDIFTEDGDLEDVFVKLTKK